MIDDGELRDLFAAESAEHLERLERCFQSLEQAPQDPRALEESFREAHSLKGAARMLGLVAIEQLAHRIEGILGAAHQGRRALSEATLEPLFRGLAALRALVAEALTGTPSPVDSAEVGRRLRAAAGPGEAPAVRPERGAGRESGAAAEGRRPRPARAEARAGHAGDFRIDTIRVDTGRLDELMGLAGELNATRIRIDRRREQIERVVTLWEALSKPLPVAGGGLHADDGARIDPAAPAAAQLGRAIASLREGFDGDTSRLRALCGELVGKVTGIRLLPFATLFRLFPPMVRELAREGGKQVRLVVEGGEATAGKRILEALKDPLMHILRNAVGHGIEPPAERTRIGKPAAGTVTLRAFRTPAQVVVEASDDGRGVDLEALGQAAVRRGLVSGEELPAMSAEQRHALMFLPGVSTSPFVTDLSGRGIGLDVVRANVEQLKGSLEADSAPGCGLTIRLRLPLTTATLRAAIVQAGGIHCALPFECIRTIRRIEPAALFTFGGRRTALLEGRPVPAVRLGELLGVWPGDTRESVGPAPPAVVIAAGEELLILLVDRLLDEQEIDLRPPDRILRRVRNISGMTILGDGDPCLILNPDDLVRSARKLGPAAAGGDGGAAARPRRRVLVADDSITVRTQIKRILEGAGCDVTVAVDGRDALERLGQGPFDALVSDVMMPNMDGFSLTERIRQDEKLRELPVILVTSLASDEDRKRGAAAGADAYITKPSFDQRTLIETLERLA